MNAEPIALTSFIPAHLPSLVEFLDRVLVGHRHWAPITQADFTERVLTQAGFDPAGLILALAGERVVGGVHAIKPLPLAPATPTRSSVTMSPGWLLILPGARGTWAAGC